MTHFDPKITVAEENYVKTIFKIHAGTNESVSTNALAERMQTKAASVTEMIRKLQKKKLVNYERYKGVTLTEYGKEAALYLIRKHRLWEVFLHQKLGFNWEDVHVIAEQLEHTHSQELIRRLDKFLGFPQYDPHGDPIPTESGEIPVKQLVPLHSLEEGEQGVLSRVLHGREDVLKWLNDFKIGLGTTFTVLSHYAFDASMRVSTGGKQVITVSQTLSDVLQVEKSE